MQATRLSIAYYDHFELTMCHRKIEFGPVAFRPLITQSLVFTVSLSDIGLWMSILIFFTFRS
jgi:hypothetical protein